MPSKRDYVEVVDNRIHSINSGPINYDSAREGLTYLQNFEPTHGASIGTPLDQMDNTGRMLTPKEILSNRVLTLGKNKILAIKKGVPEYIVVADYTSTPFYLRENGKEVRLQLGQVPDNTVTKVPPSDTPATFNGKTWVVSEETLAGRIRDKRNLLLLQSDHLVQPDYPTKDLKAVELYRQELRDITQQPKFPNSVVFPETPEELQ